MSRWTRDWDDRTVRGGVGRGDEGPEEEGEWTLVVVVVIVTHIPSGPVHQEKDTRVPSPVDLF